MIMKKILLLALIPFLFLQCKKEITQTVDISIVTYNVAGLPQGLSSSNPETYSPLISPLLNEYDIIHVQEDFCYHDDITSQINHPYITQTSGCVPGGDGMNTFSNYRIEDVDRVAWSNCTGADCLTPKGFHFTRIEIFEGVFLDFYNVHCNAGGDNSSLEARRGNILQLKNYINEHSQNNAAIVMGDFNCRYTRDGDDIRTMLDLGFQDAWLELLRNGEVPALSPDKLNNCDPERNQPDCETVDKIFYRGNSDFEIKANTYQLDDDRYYYQGDLTEPLSDHWPIFVDLNIQYTSEK